MPKKFNNNSIWTIAVLFIFILVLKSYNIEIGNLYWIFFTFVLFITIPAALIFKSTSTLFFSQAIGILPFVFWYKTHNPFIIKTPLFILFLSIALIQLVFEKKKIVLNLLDIIFLSSGSIFIISLFLNSFSNRLMEFTFFFCGLYSVYFLFKQSDEKIKLIHFWIYIGTFIAVYGIIQWLGLDPFMPMERFKTPFTARIIGTLGNPNFYSGYLIGILSFTLYYFFRKPTKILGIALFLQLIALFATGTRGVLIALFLSILIFIFTKKSKALIAIFIILIALLFLIPSMRQRMVSIPRQLTKKTGSLGQRMLMWHTAMKMIKKNPLGMGLAGFRLNYPEYQGQYLKNPHYLKLATHARHPHNEFFEMALNGGPILLLLYILLLLFIIWTLFLKEDDAIFQSAIFAILTMFIHNIASVVLNYSPPLSNFAILLGIIFIFIKSKNKFHFNSKFLYFILIFNVFLFLFWTRATIGSYHFANGVGAVNAYSSTKDIRYLKSARSELLKSVKYDPIFVNSWYRLGNVELLLAKVDKNGPHNEKALKYLEKANSLQPHYFEIRYNMGLAYISQGI